MYDVRISELMLQQLEKNKPTCLPTDSAISCEYPSRYSKFTSCSAADKFDIDMSQGTIGG